MADVGSSGAEPIAPAKTPIQPIRRPGAGLPRTADRDAPGSPEAEATPSVVTAREQPAEMGTRPQRPVSLTARKPATTARDRARPAEAAVENHRVQPGDTFSSLAKTYYGDVKYAEFLMKSNPQIADPRRMAVGALVRIPPRPQDDALGTPSTTTTPRRTAVDARRTYRVRPGDSFYAIARDMLGDSSRWKELFELNKQLVHGDPTRLRVDQVIVLPNP
jgi:nucleoid-associated protein YgaU